MDGVGKAKSSTNDIKNVPKFFSHFIQYIFENVPQTFTYNFHKVFI